MGESRIESDLVTDVWRLALVGYFTVSTICLLLLDYLITFSREVELVWKAPWSFPKVVYLAARYTSIAVIVPLISMRLYEPDLSLCLGLHVTTIWSTWFSFALGEIIFSIRTYAIMGRTHKALYFLVGTYILSMGSQFSLNIYTTRTIYRATARIGHIGCNIGGNNHMPIYIELACLLLFETAVGLLTLFKAYQHLRGVELSRAPLLVTLYRDGLLFYVYSAVISLANIVVIAMAPEAFLGLIFSVQRVFHSIFAARVVLHIREVRVGTDGRSFSISTFEGVGCVTMSTHVNEELELEPCRGLPSISHENR